MKVRLFICVVALGLTLSSALGAVSLSARGDVAMGVGAGVVSINRTPIGIGGSGGWFTDDEVCYQNAQNVIALFDRRTSQSREVAPSGANSLKCGGGVYAAWLAGVGVYTSTDLRLPTAGLADVGPDGAIAYVPDYQTGLGVVVHERDGSEWRLSNGVVYDLQLLGQHRAIWREGLSVRVAGLPIPTTLPKVWRPRAAFCAGEEWLSYWTEPQGLVLHPSTETRGKVLSTTDAFAHDMTCIGSTLIVAWSRHEGERPEDLERVELDLPSMPRVELSTSTPPVITPPIVTPPITPPTTEPQPIACGRIPDVGQQALRTLWAVPQINALVRGDDDQRRTAATVYFAPQLAFTLGPEWGSKRADPGRPLSKDAMAIVKQGHLCSWDIVNGTTRELVFGEGEDITGQVFVPVTPKNWLAELGGGGGTTPPPTGDIEALKRRVAELESQIVTLQNTTSQLTTERDDARRRVAELEVERDQLKARIADLEKAGTQRWSCRGFLRVLGMRVPTSCEVFPTPQ